MQVINQTHLIYEKNFIVPVSNGPGGLLAGEGVPGPGD